MYRVILYTLIYAREKYCKCYIERTNRTKCYIEVAKLEGKLCLNTSNDAS
mgnify:CR=1 FL=1